jgi:hypothetical protein
MARKARISGSWCEVPPPPSRRSTQSPGGTGTPRHPLLRGVPSAAGISDQG